MNVTLGFGGAWGVVSTDTICVHLTQDATERDWKRPPTYLSKLAVFPALRLTMIAAGILGPVKEAARLLYERNERLADIGTIAPALPQQLREIGARHDFAVALVGWDRAAGCVRGLVIASNSGFEAQPIRGHLMHPAPDADDVDYPALVRKQNAALAPAAAEEFHRALATNQLRTSAAGKYPAPFVCGGQILTARINRDGVHVSAIDEGELLGQARAAA